MNELTVRARQIMERLAEEEGLPERERNLFGYTARFLRREEAGQPHPPEERRLMERGESCMERLGRGRDPMSGGPLGADSRLGRDRLPVCFRYAAMAYRRALEPPLEPLACRLDPGAAEGACTPAPQALGQFTRQLNELLGYGKLPWFFGYAATAWLRQEGLLEKAEREGKTVFLPTRRGLDAGLTVREGGGETLCSREAQRLLADRAGEILSREAERWEALLARLTPETCIRIPCGPEPLALTRLLERFRAFLEVEEAALLDAKRMNLWLAGRGLLEENAAAAGRRCWVPTEAGRALGIGCRQNHSVYWTVPAQQYLADHLREAALALRTGAPYRP